MDAHVHVSVRTLTKTCNPLCHSECVVCLPLLLRHPISQIQTYPETVSSKTHLCFIHTTMSDAICQTAPLLPPVTWQQTVTGY